MHRLRRPFHPSPFHLRPRHPSLPRKQTRTLTLLPRRTSAPTNPPQYVRFQRPWLPSRRRFATIAFYTAITYAYIHFFFPTIKIEIKDADDHSKNSSSGTNDNDDFDEDYDPAQSFFFPFTRATPLPRTFYKGSDPEWRAFIAIAKDSKKRIALQEELKAHVLKGAIAHPLLVKHLGGDPKIGKFWLDINFPDGPPPESSREGIEFTNDGHLRWSKQNVDPEDLWRHQRALWPKATAAAFYNSLALIGRWTWNSAKVATGLGTPGAAPERELERMLMAMTGGKHPSLDTAAAKAAPKDKPVVAHGHKEATSSSSSAIPRERGPWSLPLPPLPSLASISPRNLIPWLPTSLPSDDDDGSTPISMQAEAKTALLIHTFRSNLAKHWNPPSMEPPRGCFVIQGLVEVKGARGRVLFDVSSCYSTTERKFVVVNAKVRGVKKWKQGPKGAA